MKFSRLQVALAAAVSSALLSGCDVIGGASDPEAIDLQILHPGGAVLQVLSVSTGNERTEVVVRIVNGRDREIRLNGGREQSYLLTQAGEKLLLIPPGINPQLGVPAGQTIEASLVFEGEVPGVNPTTLVLNERTASDNIYSASPRFETPLEAASMVRTGQIGSASALAVMRPNATSALHVRTVGGTSLDGGGLATSELEAVEALKTELGAVETERGTLISLPGDVTFDFDKSTIKAEARNTLDRLADLIGRTAPALIAIEGHTDARGDDAYNQRLSERRANAVVEYLVAKGVREQRLRARGFGETRPVAGNTGTDGTDDEAGRQRNRRVEVIFPRSADTRSLPEPSD